MEKTPTVTVYLQVYNARSYIRQCVESVLRQTCPNFECFILDNGSTDGCKEILEEYAAADQRIRLLRHDKNYFPESPPGARISRDEGRGQYYTLLDADDWWEPDYLERLLSLAQENDLDIVCTGTVMHHERTGAVSRRDMKRKLVFDEEEFAQGFPWYHAFFRTTWGKLFRMDCVKAGLKKEIPWMVYGSDTLWSFRILRQARRVSIDDSALYHYRIHGSSVSHQYDPRRFDSDIYLYNDAIDFLSAFGPISAQNRTFLQCVYANAVADTVGVIRSSTLSPLEKLREYRTIAENPITQAAYRMCADESAHKSRSQLLLRVLEAGAALNKQDCEEDLQAVAQALLPRCGQTVSRANAALFYKEQTLQNALLQDDSDALLEGILTRLKDNQGVKSCHLPETLQALAVNHPLLCQIDDATFLRRHTGIYRKVWRNELLPALEDMTGLLLEGRVSGGRETFLQLYISLAAKEEQVPAFLFGKQQLAELYLRQNRFLECRAIVEEFAEMGAWNEDIEYLRQRLDTTP